MGCFILPSIRLLKERKRTVIRQHAQPNDAIALTQVLTTLTALGALWWVAVMGASVSLWVTAVAMAGISLFTLRVFALMHECGHGSLFRSQWLNRAGGFVLGVIAGMPQYVWSRHHSYHHAHNGNWQKYRGPYATRSVSEYGAMTPLQRFGYRCKCSLASAPVVGFIYLIFNPRYTWLNGSIRLLAHMVRAKISEPRVALRAHAASFKTRFWQSPKEYWHMFWNNAVLLTAWAVMCYLCGVGLFFSIYIVSVSLAGGAGVVLFTVQHNFEHAYAGDDETWDYDSGAISGTSFLILPGFLNWFTANIGYHHIHHLSARIPNYCLVACHNQNRHLFSDVRRVRLAHVHEALRCILWDRPAQRIITIAEYRSAAQAHRTTD